jgi:hypothetical protein
MMLFGLVVLLKSIVRDELRKRPKSPKIAILALTIGNAGSDPATVSGNDLQNNK